MKVLFVYKHKRTFVENDIKILSKHYDVTLFFFSGLRCIPKLLLELHKTDIIFIWFASYHAFITSILSKKPKIVVTGGYDVAGEREIKYGLMLRPTTKRMVRYVLNKADKILSVSYFNKKELEKHLGITRSVVVYNGVDIEKFKPSKNIKKKKNLILTVGYVNKENWIRKGVFEFSSLAFYSRLKEKQYQFVVVGKVSQDVKNKIKYITEKTDNIRFMGYLPFEQLLTLYQQAKVYCQLSYYESYGLAPAEAMACGCIPVVTEKTALPEVVGEKGFKVLYGTTQPVMQAIEFASKSDFDTRKHIIDNFSLEKREEKLKEILDEYTN